MDTTVIEIPIRQYNMRITEILIEGVAGPKKCWPNHRKVGTQPGTGKNAGKRVNDCEKIKEDEAAKKGLYYYVNKRKKAGTSRPASSPKAPSAQAWKDAAKTAKKEGVVESSLNEFDPGEEGFGPFKVYVDDEFLEKFATFDQAKEEIDFLRTADPKSFDADWKIIDGTGKTVWQHDPGEAIDAMRMRRKLQFIKPDEGVEEELDELHREFDMIESIIESIADQHAVDAELVWEDLAGLSDDELYVFAVTSEMVNEDWQKANKKDKTDGMSKKAVNAYRRENPGSKLKTAVTTKPGKLKKGSKASKRRSSYCSRSAGQQKMHNISCSKTPDKAICKARRRWNC